ncbi:helix-turn-helix domain-containing protein [Georgenia muralis]
MSAVWTTAYLDLLARDADPAEFDRPVDAARRAGADAAAVAEVERAREAALRVREVLEARRRREHELSALFQTAGDLASLTDVDAVLHAIVSRSRDLLHSDVAYLSLMDAAAGDTYMRVTVGCTSELFRAVRLSLGAGLGGMVAQTGTAYATSAYFEDHRIDHTATIDAAVADEGLSAILGVPLVLGGQLIGVLYAAHRSVRPFAAAEIALLTSFAAHAAIALDKARALSETRAALRDLQVADEMLRARTVAVERAAEAHDRFFGLVLRGGDAAAVAAEVRTLLAGDVLVVDADGTVLAAAGSSLGPTAAEAALARRAAAAGRTLRAEGVHAAPVVAGADVLGALLLRRGEPLEEADRRILERAALVSALLLLFRRSVAAAEDRLRGELLEDVLLDRDGSGLPARARRAGIDLTVPHAVVVAEIAGERGLVADAGASVAAARGGLSAVHDGRLVIVLPHLTPAGAGTLVSAEVARRTGRSPTAGLAGPAVGSHEVRAAHAEALRCLGTLQALGRTGEAAGSADLGFVGLLLADDRDVPAYVRSVLGPVLDYDERRGTELVATLRAYFAEGAAVARTAAALHLHANTVTQRLDRVTRLLGSDWSAPERRLEVQLALRLEALVRRPA